MPPSGERNHHSKGCAASSSPPLPTPAPAHPRAQKTRLCLGRVILGLLADRKPGGRPGFQTPREPLLGPALGEPWQMQSILKEEKVYNQVLEPGKGWDFLRVQWLISLPVQWVRVQCLVRELRYHTGSQNTKT